MTEKPMRCSGCNKEYDPNDLDAIILDPDGNEASDETYCETCHPKFRRFDHDKWRPNHEVDFQYHRIGYD